MSLLKIQELHWAYSKKKNFEIQKEEGKVSNCLSVSSTDSMTYEAYKGFFDRESEASGPKSLKIVVLVLVVVTL